MLREPLLMLFYIFVPTIYHLQNEMTITILLRRFPFGAKGEKDRPLLRTIRARRYAFRYSQIGVDQGVTLFSGINCIDSTILAIVPSTGYCTIY